MRYASLDAHIGVLCQFSFLRKNEKTGKWYDVGDKKAAEKTSQALREKGHDKGEGVAGGTPAVPAGTSPAFLLPTPTVAPALGVPAVMQEETPAVKQEETPAPKQEESKEGDKAEEKEGEKKEEDGKEQEKSEEKQGEPEEKDEAQTAADEVKEQATTTVTV